MKTLLSLVAAVVLLAPAWGQEAARVPAWPVTADLLVSPDYPGLAYSREKKDWLPFEIDKSVLRRAGFCDCGCQNGDACTCGNCPVLPVVAPTMAPVLRYAPTYRSTFFAPARCANGRCSR